MTKARERARKQKDDNAAKGLLDALAFVALAQNPKSDNPQHAHCLIQDGFITATDGSVAVGIAVQETVQACPQTVKLREALTMCVATLQMTIDDNSLKVKSGKFSRTIKCMPVDDYYRHLPDHPLMEVGEGFREAIEGVSVLASERHDRMVFTTVRLFGQTAMASDRKTILEMWHGHNIPIEINLPKKLVMTLTKVKKKLVSFGCSEHSATFWFEDGSFLKGQLAALKWPDLSGILDMPTNPWPLPADFFTAIEATSTVDEVLNRVDFKEGCVSSPDGSAVFEIEGLPEGLSFSGKPILQMREFMHSVDFVSSSKGLLFFGNGVRGTIARLVD